MSNIWLSSFGSYNDLPKPIRPSDIHEFLGVYSQQDPEKDEYRQIMGNDHSAILGSTIGTYTPVRILWFHQCAFLITMPKLWSIDRGKTGNGSKIIYHDLPKYFKIGCDHDYVEISAKESAEIGVTHFGMCYHVYRCEKCGCIMETDSSD